jgi:hypothetical protein
MPIGLLMMALLVGCGSTASRRQPEPEATGGAPDDRPSSAGEGAIAGSAGAIAGSAGATAGSAGAAGVGGTGAGPSVGGSGGLAGSAGAAGSPPLMLPAGCEARSPVETSDTCSLAVDCNTSASLRTYCYRMESGPWECQCANQDSIYQVENIAGLQACALAAELCSGADLELGEESCERTKETSEEDSCVIDVSCGKPVKLGAAADAEARLMRFGTARCNRSGSDEAFSCSCKTGEPTHALFSLLADGGDAACGPFADLCMSGVSPVFDGEEQCLLGYFDSDAESCQRFASCGPEMTLGDDVSMLDLEQRHASCVATPDGGSDCSCSNSDSGFSFHLATPPNDASCEASIHNCDPNAVTETTGPASCEPLGAISSDQDACDVLLSCAQDGTIDGQSLLAKGIVNLMCRRAEPGMPWKCSCMSGPETTKFELGAPGASAEQACTQAPATCLDRLGVHLGPSMDLQPLPDPLL